jgi:hypothetical protein
MPTAWPSPAIAESGPRPVKFTQATVATIRAFRWLSLLVVALGIPIVLIMADRLEELVQRGTVVQGIVDDLSEKRGKSTTYVVEYEYTLSGITNRDQESVPKSTYMALRVGDRVPVTALPDRPESHRFGRFDIGDVRDLQFNGSVLVMAISAVFGLVVAGVRTHAKNELTVLGSWRALPAQAIRITKGSAGKSGVTYTLRYRVLLPGGNVKESSHSFTQPDPFELKVGEFFTVLLDPEIKTSTRPLFSVKAVEISEEA